MATAVFVVTTVGIDGISMLPTLHDGERALVPRYESWWLRLSGGSWQRGDLVYFRPPGSQPRTVLERLSGGPYLIKRVAAVAGQTVEMSQGRLWLDGVLQEESYLDPERVATGQQAPILVPDGHVYLLGDNRAPLASYDSRAFGPVALERVAGRASWVVWPWLRRAEDGHWVWNLRQL